MDRFKVVIVGGGTAGWMTAAYLARHLQRRATICVVEPPDIPTVGVGEATFSTIRVFFDCLGLKEEDWMPHCNASYKLAIRFVDWNAAKRHFYHPFQRFVTVQGRSVGEWWFKLQKQLTTPFDYACFTVPAICDAQRSPRYLDGRVFDASADERPSAEAHDTVQTLENLRIQYPYAYHFDAALLAKFLSRYAQLQGAVCIADEVRSVARNDKGFITAVRTRHHGDVEGELFVDCTGFRGLLINKVMGEPFESFQRSLPCDSAVAMQVPSADRSMNPYTSATALSSGWVWNIPLFHRVGTGYVYCSSFLSASDAEDQLRCHLGPRAAGCEAKHIKMRVGRNRRSWVKNCISIGLSSGFVEPLESTGIFFIQHGIEQLASHFPAKLIDERVVSAYNRSIADCIDGVRDFLVLHYVASTRTDTPFWAATKYDLQVPTELGERLKLWQTRIPTNRTINPQYHGFEAYSYAVMLQGLGHCPQQCLPLLHYIENERALQMFASIKARSQHLARTLPSLREYLDRQHGPIPAQPASEATFTARTSGRVH